MATKKKASKKQQSSPTSTATLAIACDGYVAALEQTGKSATTISSYAAELQTARTALGACVGLSELTPERVREYFESDVVTKKRSGKPKSPLSIDKTRRVLRQVLVWAQGAGLVEKAPLPEVTPAG